MIQRSQILLFDIGYENVNIQTIIGIKPDFENWNRDWNVAELYRNRYTCN